MTQKDKKAEAAADKKEVAATKEETSTPAPVVEKKADPRHEAVAEQKKQKKMADKTDPSRTASENVEAGGHPSGETPAGST
jgi:hypothetical protein